MASSVTDSQMNNEEDDESNNRNNTKSPVDDQEEARASQDDDDATKTLRSEDVVVGIDNNHIDDNVIKEQDRREDDDKSPEQESKKEDGANTKKNGEDKDGDQMTEIQKNLSEKQTEGYSKDNEHMREIKEKLSDKKMDGYSEGNEGLLSKYGEDLDLTKSQDGIDKDCTYEPQQHFKLQKWSDMGDLQEGHGTGTGNIQQDFSNISPIRGPEPWDSVDRFDDVYNSDGTSFTHHRDLTFDHGSSVDYPEDSPGTSGQTSYSDAGNVHNIRNQQSLETILESDSDEPQETQLKGKEDEHDKRKEDKHNKGKEDDHSRVQKDEHSKEKHEEHHKGKENGHSKGKHEEHKGKEDGHDKGKEDEKVMLLRKGNIHKLLQHLLEMKVLTEGEYRRCVSRPKREEMCAEMMKIVQKKSGGESLLKQALKEVKVEDGSPRKVKVSPKLLMEKEREISSLKAKIAMLQKELMTKSDEIKDLKKVKPINVVEPLITDRERNMIHTITERRRASRELEAQPNLSAAISAATSELQQELEDLKHELMVKDQEMKVVENLKDMYPYITDVLGCPKFPIKLPDHDSTVPMYCPEMKLSLTNANPKACQIFEEVVLINEPSPDNTNGYRKYQGTSGSTPFLLPVVVSKMLPHPIQYWETHTVVSLDCMILSFHTLFEIGVCEESMVDKMSWLYKSPRSWSIRIGICRNHHWGVCAQVYGSAAKHGLCFTHVMSNIPEKTSTLCYGIVLDVGTGKVGLIDIGKERVLHTFNVEFRENLYPMFGVQPLADACSINMALMSGDQVEMTERKERLIIKALSKQ